MTDRGENKHLRVQQASTKISWMIEKLVEQHFLSEKTKHEENNLTFKWWAVK